MDIMVEHTYTTWSRLMPNSTLPMDTMGKHTYTTWSMLKPN